MGNSAPKAVPRCAPVTSSKTRICVIGFSLSHHTGRAATLARLIVSKYPSDYESWFYFDSKGYRGADGLLPQIKRKLTTEQQSTFQSHNTSPFVWLETAPDTLTALGGRDRFCDWAVKTFPSDDEIKNLATTEPSYLELVVDQSPGTSPFLIS
jgi:hypothetical protein